MLRIAPLVVGAPIGGRGVPRPEAVDRKKRHSGRCCTVKEEPNGPRPRNFLSKGLGEDYRLFRWCKINGYLGNPGSNVCAGIAGVCSTHSAAVALSFMKQQEKASMQSVQK